MQGKRVPDAQDGVGFGLRPGEYGKLSTTWLCQTPNGHMGNLSAHHVVENPDGTITVTPSILVEDDGGELWHGYLTAGVWRGVGRWA